MEYNIRMPTVEWNNHIWNGSYDWSQHGDEWSEAWGGSEAQWYWALLPRIRRLLPRDGAILEIAPGFGRWTQHLQRYCRLLIGVDLSAQCVAACRERFADCPHLVFHQNDGRSLGMVEPGHVDFAFSFDSLVHVGGDVLAAYIDALATRLTPNGAAFLHHSNLGEWQADIESGALSHEFLHNRDASVTGEAVAAMVEAAGLHLVSQEYVNWGGAEPKYLIDCVTVFSRDSRASAPRIVHNPRFMDEARNIAAISRLYF